MEKDGKKLLLLLKKMFEKYGDENSYFRASAISYFDFLEFGIGCGADRLLNSANYSLIWYYSSCDIWGCLVCLIMQVPNRILPSLADIPVEKSTRYRRHFYSHLYILAYVSCRNEII